MPRIVAGLLNAVHGPNAGWCSLVAATLLLATGGALGQQGQSCVFVSGSSGAMNFGSLDPSVTAVPTAVWQVQTLCTSPPQPDWSFSGLYGNAPLRMKHSSREAYIPYTVSLQQIASSSPPTSRTWRITATLRSADYQNAPVGTYSDVLRATILP